MCLFDRQLKTHCNPGEAVESYWSHVNALGSCLDWSSTQQEPDELRLLDALLLLMPLQCLVLSDEALVGQLPLGQVKRLGTGHLGAAVGAQSCCDAGQEEKKIRS